MDERGADGEVAPADRLRARAEVTDRSARFRRRLAEVERVRARRRRMAVVGRVAWVVVGAGTGPLVALLLAAVVNGSDPSSRALLVATLLGAVAGALGPVLRDVLARRRGAVAWDAYRERYVLIGEPAAQVRDADRPHQQRGGPPPPPDRR